MPLYCSIAHVSIRAPHSHAGRLSVMPLYCSIAHVSIRAPHSHAGRLSVMPLYCSIAHVSIRAPHSHARRRINTLAQDDDCGFQSAPRILMRGDLIGSSQPTLIRRFNPRPAFSCGATSGSRWSGSQAACFNPRPAFSCGATRYGWCGAGTKAVSIRAPHSHAGRPEPVDNAAGQREFQSAPRILMRGDVLRTTSASC